jgi:hypothetical protein
MRDAAPWTIAHLEGHATPSMQIQLEIDQIVRRMCQQLMSHSKLGELLTINARQTANRLPSLLP